MMAALTDGLVGDASGGAEAEALEEAGVIERRRIWIDVLLADYIWDELGFPGARHGAMLERESVAIGTGGGEPGALESDDRPEFTAVRPARVTQAVPQPLER